MFGFVEANRKHVAPIDSLLRQYFGETVTDREIAERGVCCRNTLYAIRRGDHMPQRRVVRRIASALGGLSPAYVEKIIRETITDARRNRSSRGAA